MTKSSAYRTSWPRWPHVVVQMRSSSFRYTLESSGEITPPCGVPADVVRTAPSSMTPASSHCLSSLSTRRSEIRFDNNSMSRSWSIASKNPWMSASTTW